jgi:hypothetical protein
MRTPGPSQVMSRAKIREASALDYAVLGTCAARVCETLRWHSG